MEKRFRNKKIPHSKIKKMKLLPKPGDTKHREAQRYLLSEKIAKELEQRGIVQYRAALHIGEAPQMVYRALAKNSPGATLDNLERIIRALGMKIIIVDA